MKFLTSVNSLYLCAVTLAAFTAGSSSAVAQVLGSQKSSALAPVATEVAPDTKDAAAEQTTAAKDKEAESPEYVRIQRNERRLATALQTSIIQFTDSKKYPGTTVDLIGAIHLGETSYYEELNKRFKDYEVVLFEAVMPEKAVARDMRPGVGKRGSIVSGEQEWNEAKIGLAAIGALQVGMKDALGLDFQLTTVDYSPRNFVHADMTQEEFESTMAARGESFSQLLAQEMAKASVAGQKSNPIAQQLDFMLSMMTSDRVYRVRRIAAVELTKANEGTAFAGSDGTSTIITERNSKAFQVLRDQLFQGKKKIAVFYGAGHFPDMEERLIEKFGYQRNKEDWITAWELTAKK
ncbi:MAG: hypothetical protein ABJZ55_23335 [Fuerstiella sp.]